MAPGPEAARRFRHLVCLPPGADPAARGLHLFRHGEATHKVHAREQAALGLVCRCFEPAVLAAGGPGACPYWDDALVDAPLTERGRRQARQLAGTCEAEVVLTSPLSRALESALLAFPPPVPVVALEELRARTGAHRHSRRRDLAALREEFPRVDFSRIQESRDALWSEHDEPRASLDARVARVVEEVLARPERSVALVTHFTTLLALFQPAADPMLLGTNEGRARDDPAFLDCTRDVALAPLGRWLEVGELRPLQVVGDA